MKIKLRCADNEAREEIHNLCESKKDKSPFETLLCEIVPFAEDCERE